MLAKSGAIRDCCSGFTGVEQVYFSHSVRGVKGKTGRFLIWLYRRLTASAPSSFPSCRRGRFGIITFIFSFRVGCQCELILTIVVHNPTPTARIYFTIIN